MQGFPFVLRTSIHSILYIKNSQSRRDHPTSPLYHSFISIFSCRSGSIRFYFKDIIRNFTKYLVKPISMLPPHGPQLYSHFHNSTTVEQASRSRYTAGQKTVPPAIASLFVELWYEQRKGKVHHIGEHARSRIYRSSMITELVD